MQGRQRLGCGAIILKSRHLERLEEPAQDRRRRRREDVRAADGLKAEHHEEPEEPGQDRHRRDEGEEPEVAPARRHPRPAILREIEQGEDEDRPEPGGVIAERNAEPEGRKELIPAPEDAGQAGERIDLQVDRDRDGRGKEGGLEDRAASAPGPGRSAARPSRRTRTVNA